MPTMQNLECPEERRALRRLRQRLRPATVATIVALQLLVPALIVKPAPAAAASPRMAAAGTLRDCVEDINVCGWHTRIAAGTTLKMSCWEDGRTATGRYSSNRWFYVTTPSKQRGFVHSSWVENQTTVGRCSSHVGVRAAAWAAEQRGRRSPRPSEAAQVGIDDGRWQGWCKGFAAMSHEAFGRNVVGGDAWDTWQHFRSAGVARTSVDPDKIAIGSLVFYDVARPYGHVAVYVGNGYVMSTQGSYGTTTGRGLPIARLSLTHWGEPVGWVHPGHVTR